MADLQRYKIRSLGGETDLLYELPDFMLEETAQKLLAIAEMHAKAANVSKESLEGVFKAVSKSNVNAKEAAEDNADGLKNLGKVFKTGFGHGFNRHMEKSLRVFGTLAQNILTGIGATAAVVGGIVFQSLTGLGKTLNTLSDVGLAFGDISQPLSKTIAELNKLGITTSRATELLQNHSRVFATRGHAATVELIEVFQKNSREGKDFGITLSEASGIALEGAEFYQKMLGRSILDQGKLSDHILHTTHNLQKFSTVLGMSKRDVDKSTQATMENSLLFKNYILGLGEVEGLKVTASMKAIGDAISASFGLEAGALLNEIVLTGIGGFEELLPYFPGLFSQAPELVNMLTNIAESIKDGSFDSSSAAIAKVLIDMRKSVDSLDHDAIMSILSSSSSEHMQAIQLLLQSSSKSGKGNEVLLAIAASLQLTFEEAQLALNSWETAKENFTSSLNLLSNTLATHFGPTFEKIADRIKRAMGTDGIIFRSMNTSFDNVKEAFIKTFGGKDLHEAAYGDDASMKVEDAFLEAIDSLIIWIGKKIEQLGDFITRFITRFETDELDDDGNKKYKPLGQVLWETFEKEMPGIVDALAGAIWSLFSHPDVIKALAVAAAAVIGGAGLAYGAGKAATWAGRAAIGVGAGAGVAAAAATSQLELFATKTANSKFKKAAAKLVTKSVLKKALMIAAGVATLGALTPFLTAIAVADTASDLHKFKNLVNERNESINTGSSIIPPGQEDVVQNASVYLDQTIDDLDMPELMLPTDIAIANMTVAEMAVQTMTNAESDTQIIDDEPVENKFIMPTDIAIANMTVAEMAVQTMTNAESDTQIIDDEPVENKFIMPTDIAIANMTVAEMAVQTMTNAESDTQIIDDEPVENKFIMPTDIAIANMTVAEMAVQTMTNAESDTQIIDDEPVENKFIMPTDIAIANMTVAEMAVQTMTNAESDTQIIDDEPVENKFIMPTDIAIANMTVAEMAVQTMTNMPAVSAITVVNSGSTQGEHIYGSDRDDKGETRRSAPRFPTPVASPKLPKDTQPFDNFSSPPQNEENNSVPEVPLTIDDTESLTNTDMLIMINTAIRRQTTVLNNLENTLSTL